MEFENCRLVTTPLLCTSKADVPTDRNVRASVYYSGRADKGPKEYGHFDNDDIQVRLHSKGRRIGLTISIKQPHSEGEPSRYLCDFWASAGHVLNPAVDPGGQNIICFWFRYIADLATTPAPHTRSQGHRILKPIDLKDDWRLFLISRLKGPVQIEVKVPYTKDFLKGFQILRDESISKAEGTHHAANWDDYRPKNGFGRPGYQIPYNPTSFQEVNLPRVQASEKSVNRFTDAADYQITQSLALLCETRKSAAVDKLIHSKYEGDYTMLISSHIGHNGSELHAILKPTSNHAKDPKGLPDSIPENVAFRATVSSDEDSVFQLHRTSHDTIIVIPVSRGEYTQEVNRSGRWLSVALKHKTRFALWEELTAVRALSQTEVRDERIPLLYLISGIQKIHRGKPIIAIDQMTMPEQSVLRVRRDNIQGTLNSEQKQAFTAALQPSNCISCIIGPPGTGKTQVSSAVIAFLAFAGVNVIVCGGTNNQLNELSVKVQKECTRLHTDANSSMDYYVTRMLSSYNDSTLEEPSNGNSAKHLTLTHHTLQFPAEESSRRTNLQSEARSVVYGSQVSASAELKQAWDKSEQYVLKKSRIVICTHYVSTDVRLDALSFQYIVLEEAAQTLEATTIIPLTIPATRRAKGILLIGDPNQIGPIYKSTPKDGPSTEQLGTTLLARAKALGFQTTTLRAHYRSRELLMAYPNDKFYNGSLRNHYMANTTASNWDRFCQSKLLPADGLVALATKNTMAFSENKSWTNPKHTMMSVELLKLVKQSGCGLGLNAFVIVCMYNAAVKEYERGLTEAGIVSVTVTTIAGYQGNDADVVLLDFTRTAQSTDGRRRHVIQAGSVSDPRYLNVALTRARHGLVVIFDRAYSKDVTGEAKGYFDYLKNRQVIRSFNKLVNFEMSDKAASGTSGIPTESPVNDEGIMEDGSEDGELIEQPQMNVIPTTACSKDKDTAVSTSKRAEEES